jgi:subtilisin family serine protease
VQSALLLALLAAPPSPWATAQPDPNPVTLRAPVAGARAVPGLGTRLAAQIRRGAGPVRFLARGLDRRALSAAGGTILAEIGPVVSAEAPAAAIPGLARRAEYLEAPQPLRPVLDHSRALILADLADFGDGFTAPHRGADVLIAAYDSGLDLSHPDLRTREGASRVIAAWDQDTGQRCDSSSVGSCPFGDSTGHGTLVLSIAASNGPQYRGVAPEALLVAARSDLFEDFVGALAWFGEVAAQEKKPLVVNLSLAGHLGPHDSTSLEAQAIDASPHLVVAAAGNEGTTLVHARAALSPALPADLALDLPTSAGRSDAVVDLWTAPPGELVVQVVLVQGGAVVAASSTVGANDAGRDEILRFAGDEIAELSLDVEPGASPLNGRGHATVQIGVTAFDPAITGILAVRVRGTGTLDAWVDSPASSESAARFLGAGALGTSTQIVPDSALTLSDPATARSAIAVSSFVSRTEVPIAGGEPLTFGGAIGALSEFTSSGPSLDPERTGAKPELAAPGQVIVGALGAGAPTTGLTRVAPLYRAASGTSMAAPHVAGAAALLLELDPAADKVKLRQWLQDSADGSVLETNPDPRWGKGKLDVSAALIRAGADTSCGCFTVAPTAGLGDLAWLVIMCALVRTLSRRSSA